MTATHASNSRGTNLMVTAPGNWLRSGKIEATAHSTPADEPQSRAGEKDEGGRMKDE
jgi:hypothetical protein